MGILTPQCSATRGFAKHASAPGHSSGCTIFRRPRAALRWNRAASHIADLLRSVTSRRLSAMCPPRLGQVPSTAPGPVESFGTVATLAELGSRAPSFLRAASFAARAPARTTGDTCRGYAASSPHGRGHSEARFARGSRCPRPLRDPTKTENLRDLAARYPARSVALRRVRREAAAHQRRRADRRARACEVSSRSDFRSSELHPPKRANRAGNLHGVRRMQGPVFDVPASRRGDASPDRSNPER